LDPSARRAPATGNLATEPDAGPRSQLPALATCLVVEPLRVRALGLALAGALRGCAAERALPRLPARDLPSSRLSLLARSLGSPQPVPAFAHRHGPLSVLHFASRHRPRGLHGARAGCLVPDLPRPH